MPKNKKINEKEKPQSEIKSEKIKVQLFGYCSNCGFYRKPCINKNRCSSYLMSTMI